MSVYLGVLSSSVTGVLDWQRAVGLREGNMWSIYGLTSLRLLASEDRFSALVCLPDWRRMDNPDVVLARAKSLVLPQRRARSRPAQEEPAPLDPDPDAGTTNVETSFNAAIDATTERDVAIGHMLANHPSRFTRLELGALPTRNLRLMREYSLQASEAQLNGEALAEHRAWTAFLRVVESSSRLLQDLQSAPTPSHITSPGVWQGYDAARERPVRRVVPSPAVADVLRDAMREAQEAMTERPRRRR